MAHTTFYHFKREKMSLKKIMHNIFKPDLIIRTERINEEPSYLKKKIDKTETISYFQNLSSLKIINRKFK